MTSAQQRMVDAIQKHTRPDGWADWTAVYNEWDQSTANIQLTGNAAAKVLAALERRSVVECADGGRLRLA
jgi:hypothetical protein